MKEKIQQYLEKKYAATRWPNVYLAEVMREFGPEAINALNNLAAEGIVRKANGINGRLVIYNESPEDRAYYKEQFSKKHL